ncbi:MAG: carboxypeptidase regulatory-like domain-containing protein [Planctomycetes bacterium]|nr:carboxypeptidase regulatory-like domain-containing protein [Planctomycetota bacterium]
MTPTVELGVTATLAGRIVDESGRGVVGARFVAKLPERAVTVGADAAGVFRVDELPIHIVALVHAKAPLAVGREFEVTLVPGTRDLGDLVVTAARTLTATIVDEAGVPVPGLQVRLESVGFVAAASSDPSGQLDFGEVPRTTVELRVETAPWRLVAPVSRSCEPDVEVVRLVVARGGSLFGTVRDEAGSPLADVAVRAESSYEARPRSTTSRADGSYHLELEPQLTWDVQFERAGVPPFTATNVRGDAGRLDVILEARHRCIVRLEGDVGAGSIVELLRDDDRKRDAPPRVVARERVDPQRSRSVVLCFDSAGSYHARARSVGAAAGWRRSEPFTVARDAAPATIERSIDLAGGTTLDVELAGAGVRPGDWVFLSSSSPKRIEAERARASWLGSSELARGRFDGFDAAARVDARGATRFVALDPGEYEVLFGGALGVPATRLGVVEVAEAPARFGATVLGLGSIEGSVTTTAGKALPGCPIVCCNAFGSYRTARTDASGAFRFAELLPGRYAVVPRRSGAAVVVALGAIQIEADANENVTVRASSPEGAAGSVVIVPSGGAARCDLVVVDEENRSLEGRVECDRQGIGGALLLCRSLPDLAEVTARTTSDGRFELAGLHGARQQLEVWIDDTLWHSRTVATRAADTPANPLTIELSSGTARLRLVDGASGAPIANCVVGLSEVERREREAARRAPARFTRTTDATGALIVERLPLAEYRIDVATRGFQRPEAWLDVDALKSQEPVELALERGGWIRVSRSVDAVLRDVAGFRFELEIDGASYESTAWFDELGFAWIECGRGAEVVLRLFPVDAAGAGRRIERRFPLAPNEVATLER